MKTRNLHAIPIQEEISEGLVVVDKELSLSGDYFVLCVIFGREKGVIVFWWVEKEFKNLPLY